MFLTFSDGGMMLPRTLTGQGKIKKKNFFFFLGGGVFLIGLLLFFQLFCILALNCCVVTIVYYLGDTVIMTTVVWGQFWWKRKSVCGLRTSCVQQCVSYYRLSIRRGKHGRQRPTQNRLNLKSKYTTNDDFCCQPQLSGSLSDNTALEVFHCYAFQLWIHTWGGIFDTTTRLTNAIG